MTLKKRNSQVTVSLPEGVTFTHKGLMSLIMRDHKRTAEEQAATLDTLWGVAYAISLPKYGDAKNKAQLVKMILDHVAVMKLSANKTAKVVPPAQDEKGERVYSNGTTREFFSPQKARERHENTINNAEAIIAIYEALLPSFTDAETGKVNRKALQDAYNAEVKNRFGETCGCRTIGEKCFCNHAKGAIVVEGKGWMPTRKTTLPNIWGKTKTFETVASKTDVRQPSPHDTPVTKGKVTTLGDEIATAQPNIASPIERLKAQGFTIAQIVDMSESKIALLLG